jgi:hypothetical protein
MDSSQIGATPTASPQPLTYPEERRPLASYWHTAMIIFLMVAVGLMSAHSFKTGRAPAASSIALYIPTIIWLWSLSLIVYAGVRYRGNRISDVFGRTWKNFDDVLMDFIVAFGFWFAVVIVLVSLKLLLMHATGTPAPKSLPTEMRALAPQGLSGIGLWIVLSLTAGICEEFVFRGYLQKQFIALTKNVPVGIVLSAAVFMVGHLYEGLLTAVVIAVFGILLGTLAHVRRSLAPGMIAHAWHDIFSGVLLALLTQAGK